MGHCLLLALLPDPLLAQTILIMHFLLLLFITFVVGSAATSSASPTATVRNGSYYGTHSSIYNQDFFLGIPFAQPPLQQLRFANPQPLNWSWSGELPATNYAYVCLQIAKRVRTNNSRNVLAMEVIRLVINRYARASALFADD